MAQGIINNQMLWVPVRRNVAAAPKDHRDFRVGEITWLREIVCQFIQQGTECLVQQAFGWFGKGCQPIPGWHFAPFRIAAEQLHVQGGQWHNAYPATVRHGPW